LGVPLFQEQAMKIAIVAAGFTPAEADELRRSMATFKAKGMVSNFHQKLINGMTQRGYTHAYALRVFKQLEGFGSYGFPESHAASFALLVYVSAWIKCYYPDVFACALLNSMPMGFYQPAQIVSDAQKHGVEVRAVDVNYSQWDNLLEKPPPSCFRQDTPSGGGLALRLGFRQVKGLREEDIKLLDKLITDNGINDNEFIKGEGQLRNYLPINELRDIGLPEATLVTLADADAFRSIGLDRRQALWEVSTKDRPVVLFKGQQSPDAKDENVLLPVMTMPEHVVQDYASLSLSIKAHPVSFLREKLQQLHIVSTADLSSLKNGDMVKIAGLVLVRQRPGTAKGVVFITIEDEMGTANLVVFSNIIDQYRREILQSKLMMAEGKLQVEGEVIHVIVEKCFDLTRMLRKLRVGDLGNTFPEGRNFK
jgi:error-prone DNA polymerase